MLGSKIFTFGPKSGTSAAAETDWLDAAPPLAIATAPVRRAIARTRTVSRGKTRRASVLINASDARFPAALAIGPAPLSTAYIVGLRRDVDPPPPAGRCARRSDHATWSGGELA